MKARVRHRSVVYAVPDPAFMYEGDGERVAVVGSFQSYPDTGRPFKVRGVNYTPRTERLVVIELSREEARKLVRDFVSFGLFGRHGRIVDTPPSKGGKDGRQA